MKNNSDTIVKMLDYEEKKEMLTRLLYEIRVEDIAESLRLTLLSSDVTALIDKLFDFRK